MPNDLPGLYRWNWGAQHRRHQRPPAGAWRIWLFQAGRGAGKTRAAAEWIRDGARRGLWRRIALVGPSYEAVREVMIEGPSGLIAITPAAYRPRYLASRHVLRWPNGAMAQAFSAEDPDALRGPQFHAAWGDEFCAWRRPQTVLDMLSMGLRLGPDPRMVLTTTPRPIAALKRLRAQEGRGVAITTGRTADADFLPAAFHAAMEARYGGTLLGAQELDGEIVEDREGALWTWEMLEAARGETPARLDRIVVAVDPPASSGARADACGIVVAGAAGEGTGRRAYVLADASVQGRSPDGWARAVVRAFEVWRADRVIAEANQGGEMVESVLRAAASGLPVTLVRATRGKAKRAEPAAALYERGLVTHCGVFAELEAQLRALGCDGADVGDDRADALVWALHALMLDKGGRPRVRLL